MFIFYTPALVKTYKELNNLKCHDTKKMCNIQFEGDSRFAGEIREI